jgi:hypothetical protein
MSTDVAVESLRLITIWGLGERWGQLKRFAAGLLKRG